MKVHFVLNVPQQLALSDPTGEYSAEQEEVSYPTTDGRTLILPTRAAECLNDLDLRPAESFHLCRRWDGTKGTLPTFDFWISPASEKARAAEEQAQGERQEPATLPATEPAIHRNPEKHWKRQKRPRVQEMPNPQPAAQPELWDGRGTGTYGPQPRPAIAAAHERQESIRRAVERPGPPRPCKHRHHFSKPTGFAGSLGESMSRLVGFPLCAAGFIALGFHLLPTWISASLIVGGVFIDQFRKARQ